MQDEEVIQFFTGPEALEGNPELAPEANGGKLALEAVRIVRDPGMYVMPGSKVHYIELYSARPKGLIPARSLPH
jgi:hypothetical protein